MEINKKVNPFINGNNNYGFIRQDNPVAFQDLFVEQVYKTGKELLELVKEDIKLVSEDVLKSLLYDLLNLLSSISSKVLETEFSIYLASRQSSFERLLRRSGNSPSNGIYFDFIRCMQDGGFTRLLKEYPVLDRLLKTASSMWLASTKEFFLRLKSDLPIFKKEFLEENELGKVTEIQTNLSDRHHNGRTVMVLTFESGFKLVYKPRSLGLEEACFKLLGFLNNQNNTLDFKIIKTIDRGTYGWMEYVPHISCESVSKVKLFYQRVGALIAVIHSLKGLDCHFENIIASGEYPVLIDMETLFHQDFNELKKTKYETPEKYNSSNSVLRTGFLRDFFIIQDGKKYDLSGLGAGSEDGYLPKRLKWADINTDCMHREYMERQNILPANLPHIGGETFLAEDYSEDISYGFRQIYGLLEKQRRKLLSEHGLIESFRHLESRFLLRHTHFYTELLSKSLEPRFLRSAEERYTFLHSQLLEGFEHALVKNLSPLFKSEINALDHLDIPYFKTRIKDKSIILDGIHSLKNCFSSSSYNIVINTIKNIDNKDLTTQLNYIIDCW